MEWKLLTQADQVTTTWSGGTTTQLAIAPEMCIRDSNAEGNKFSQERHW